MEKETRELLLASAKQEFLEKGYQGASLRSICKNAGVTTGALYFFFQDKEDLFAAIVEPVLEKLKHMLQQHMRQELMELQQFPDAREDNMQDDMFASTQIIHLLYANYDMFTLILTKSQGLGLKIASMNSWQLWRMDIRSLQQNRRKCWAWNHRMNIRCIGWHMYRSMHFLTYCCMRRMSRRR